MQPLSVFSKGLLLSLALWMSAGVGTAGQRLTDLDFHWLFRRQAAERLFSDKDYAQALDALREVADSAPDEFARSELLAKAALARAHLGDIEQALADARAIEDKTFAQYGVLSILAQQERWDAIVAMFREAPIGDWPGVIRASGFQMRARAHEATEMPREAIADFERCFEAAGDDTTVTLPVLMRIARLHRELEDIEAVKASYRRVIDICGDPPRRLRGGHLPLPRAISGLAAILAEEERYQEAIDCINRYPTEWSTSMGLTLITQRGDIYLDWGKPEQALAAYQEGLEFAERHKGHSRSPGFIRLLTGKIEALEADGN